MPAVQSFMREVIPGGIYILKLCEIEEQESTLTRDDGSKGGKFWIWKWCGKKEKELQKPNAKCYSPQTTTGNSVSKKDSKLKFYLQSCYPEMTMEEMQKFNTDKMIGNLFRIKFGVDGEGDSQKNVVLSMEMMDEDFADPFAEDEDDD